MGRIVEVPEDAAGERLDRVLADLVGLSRRAVAQLVVTGQGGGRKPTAEAGDKRQRNDDHQKKFLIFARAGASGAVGGRSHFQNI